MIIASLFESHTPCFDHPSPLWPYSCHSRIHTGQHCVGSNSAHTHPAARAIYCTHNRPGRLHQQQPTQPETTQGGLGRRARTQARTHKWACARAVTTSITAMRRHQRCLPVNTGSASRAGPPPWPRCAQGTLRHHKGPARSFWARQPRPCCPPLQQRQPTGTAGRRAVQQQLAQESWGGDSHEVG